MRKLYTAESVTEGHPDKVCDQIADAILDAILADDKNARVACEVAATTGLVMVMGEVTTTTYVDIQDIVRKTVNDIGYNRGKFGFDAENLAVLVCLDEQSPDIALGVQDGSGAGDQGTMFGYACRETDEYMPMPIVLAPADQRLAEARREKRGLRPDGKAQVTVEYRATPRQVDSVVVPPNTTSRLPRRNSGNLSRMRSSRRLFPRDLSIRTRKYSSTRPAGSSSAARRRTAALRDGKLSSTPTAVSPVTAAARSAGKTRPKSTGAPLIWRDISRKTWYRPARPRDWKSA